MAKQQTAECSGCADPGAALARHDHGHCSADVLARAEVRSDITDFAATPSDPLTLDPARIDAQRSAWIEAWDTVTLR